MAVFASLSDLLGDRLLCHGVHQNTKDVYQLTTQELDSKNMGLYFADSTCSVSLDFTRKLAELYKAICEDSKDKLEIIFIPLDDDPAVVEKHFQEMPWKSLPFPVEQSRSNSLWKHFKIQGVPSLIVLSPSCHVLTSEGYEEVVAAGAKALRLWSEGKTLFWSRSPHADEYVWNYASCSQCYLRPLIGIRHGCSRHYCKFDLCKSCLAENKHGHPLVRYLTPSTCYTLQELFANVPYLLGEQKNERLETKSIWENEGKTVALYFSAHWCQPCREFTPKLVECFQETQESRLPFMIVFVSSDDDEESFNEYRAQMPWPSVPLDSVKLIRAYFQCKSIPSVIVLSKDGKILTRRGRYDIVENGTEAIRIWSRGEKLPPVSSDQFIWYGFRCEHCSVSPIVGERYFCNTCDNYDSCSKCQKEQKHAHDLTIAPMPTADDD